MPKPNKLSIVPEAHYDEHTSEARDHVWRAISLMKMQQQAYLEHDDDLENVALVTQDILDQAIAAMNRVDEQIAGWRATGSLMDRLPSQSAEPS